MPSTIVHMAFAGLIAAALLGDAFDRKSVAIVMALMIVPDLDSFIALYTVAGHRVVLHNAMIPLVWALLLWVDTNVRSTSLVRDRWGSRGVRVMWVCILCYLVSGIALDLTDGVVNLFWPVYDQFYTLDGRLELSDQRGIVQTFSDGGIPFLRARGTIEELRLTTGVDPGPAEAPDEEPERLFPIFRAGWQLVVFLVGTGVTIARFKLPYETPE